MEQKISGKIDNYYFSKAIDRRYSESTQHYHPHYEIYYMKEGSCRYFIDDRAFDVEAGDLVFIPYGIIHRTNYTTASHSRLLINFTEDYIPKDAMNNLMESRYLYRSREIAKNIEDLFEKIEKEYAHPDEYTRSLLYCHTAEMFYLMLRHPGNLEEATTGNELIDSIVKYIKQNYMSDIKLSSVARMKSVSPEHLSRTFKNSTGLGFNEYVTLLRLRKAEEMIKTEHNKTISEIAYECGFNDGNYFSYKFKKMFGTSPIKMRNNK
ncbi:MAG: helix-turn-helix transcriptional regulator [Clostridia bacterium]|nr:helix-turn-helix transcriptional regulator [Clostridia bacterium]